MKELDKGKEATLPDGLKEHFQGKNELSLKGNVNQALHI